MLNRASAYNVISKCGRLKQRCLCIQVELNLRIHVKLQRRRAVLVSFPFVMEIQSSFSCWGFLYFLNGTQIKISEGDGHFFFGENVWTSVSSVLCFVTYLHFSSLVIRARYVFIKLKAQQGSNKLSNNEKCLIPQEPYMPIFLKPSHKIRILNVNIVYLCVCACVCARACVCVSFDLPQVLNLFRRIPGVRLWAWMSPGSDSVATSWALGSAQWSVAHSSLPTFAPLLCIQVLYSVRHKWK